MNKLYELQSYSYDLPQELIAQYPLAQRDQARLMVIDRDRQTITHDVFGHLGKYLPKACSLVINNSKVIAARLLGVKPETSGEVELFLLRALEDGVSFEVLLKPLKKIKEGQLLDFKGGLQARLVDKAKRIVQFNQKNLLKVLEKQGHIPLPPYIKRDDQASDREDYQTVYAKNPGSVAAPTAGLHFTDELIKALKANGHDFLDITLHIGYGTFKPVESDDIRGHLMHHEYYDIPLKVHQQLVKAKQNGQKICAVGTTSCRVLESLGQGAGISGQTNLFVYPGFSFTMADCLVTNFHLPYSSLLMLVCAFGGYDLVIKAYHEAIKNRYRFYSYGDAMLII